jgi:hypothetical protein
MLFRAKSSDKLTHNEQNLETYTLSSFAEIGYGADYIMDQCEQGPRVVPGKTDFTTGGQAFNQNNWNVIVRPDDC